MAFSPLTKFRLSVGETPNVSKEESKYMEGSDYNFNNSYSHDLFDGISGRSESKLNPKSEIKTVSTGDK